MSNPQWLMLNLFRKDDAQKRRRAFTLIEVLTAVLLGAMLLAALTGTLTGLKRQRQALAAELAHPSWPRRLEGRLTSDLLNARTISIHTDRIILEGYGGRDLLSGRPTLSPARVTYRLVDSQHSGALLRDELPLATPATHQRTEFMAVGVRELLIGHPADRLQDLRIPVPAAAHPHPLSEEIRFVLVDQQGALLINQVLGEGAVR